MKFVGYSLVGVSGSLTPGKLLTPHGIWRLLVARDG